MIALVSMSSKLSTNIISGFSNCTVSERVLLFDFCSTKFDFSFYCIKTNKLTSVIHTIFMFFIFFYTNHYILFSKNICCIIYHYIMIFRW